ncbi:ROK family protein [Paenibacillus aestuarii]|uniref:ROK family protein n=1 Tax=Paenibacillus aestuarii TaxID=516965 RepID=A0ABW0KJC8_9BACL|nr:ROK family protein [Paenibacillus aestuarii]
MADEQRMPIDAGIDIGGTNTVIGLFDSQRNLLAKTTIPTFLSASPEREWTNNPEAFYERLHEAIVKLAESIGGSGCLAKVGIGVPGQVDTTCGIVIRASNMRWHDVPLAAAMRGRLGVPVKIENDVRAYTLGEALAGAGQGFRNIVCLTLGTGLAAGIIADGRLIRGGAWHAGEIGHDPVPGVAYRCNCGKTGCLETVASATGIARIAKDAVHAGETTTLAQGGNPEQLTAHEVFQACLQGDAVALGVFRQVATMLGQKLLSAIYLLNPDIVIIGGGVAAAGEILLSPIRAVLEDGYFSKTACPQICIGTLGDSAGLLGAVHLFDIS